MNRSVLQSLPVQQMNMAGGSWWNINTNIDLPSHDQINLLLSSSSNSSVSSSASPSPSSMFPPFLPLSSVPINPWGISTHEITTGSLNQLDMGGMVGEEERCSFNQFIHKKMGDWSDQLMCTDVSPVDLKQECYDQGRYSVRGHDQNITGEFQALKYEFGQDLPAAYSPRSCVTSCTLSNSMLDFSTRKREGVHQEQYPDQSLESNSQTSSAYKKARVQSTAQPPFKVRKEKLGDRVTALHQLVSPFGKTDTASVLLEAIGYIRFLQNQIEALSSPYLGSASKSVSKRQLVQTGERSAKVFPDGQGQDACMKRRGNNQNQKGSSEIEEPKKDLCSRGLCLVAVAYCTTKVGSDNGADYWAPAAAAFGGGL